MADMLVRLYDLPPLEPAMAAMEKEGIVLRRALTPEQHLLCAWVAEQFSSAWAAECAVAFARQPVSCFIALREKKIVGFSCYEVTCRDFFGPMGVDGDMRKKGVGKALLLAALHAMKNEGYAYAVIGGVGPRDFYEKTAGAMEIEGSTPGIYKGMLREKT